MPATLMSIAEFELLPDVPGKQELLQGELITLPPPQDLHNDITHAFYEALRSVLPGGRVRMEAGYRMSDDTVLQPDVSVRWPDQSAEKGCRKGSPMIAVEVLSPGNAAEKISRKTAAYLKHGAEEVWVVDPFTHRMTVHDGSSVDCITDVYHCALVPVSIALKEIWPAE